MSAFRQTTTNIIDALGAVDTISELRDELESWYDNLPENFQNGDKGSALQEAMDALDDAQSSDFSLPTELNHLDGEQLPVTSWKKGASRAKRRDDACTDLRAAQEFLAAKAEEYRAKAMADATPEELPADEDRGIGDRAPITAGEFDAADAAETLAEEIELAVDNFEGAEFPGMYG